MSADVPDTFLTFWMFQKISCWFSNMKSSGTFRICNFYKQEKCESYIFGSFLLDSQSSSLSAGLPSVSFLFDSKHHKNRYLLSHSCYEMCVDAFFTMGNALSNGLKDIWDVRTNFTTIWANIMKTICGTEVWYWISPIYPQLEISSQQHKSAGQNLRSIERSASATLLC